MTSFKETLRSLMQAANITSYRALAERAQVSRWQVKQLSVGKLEKMRVGVLMSLADALHIPLSDLLARADLLMQPKGGASMQSASVRQDDAQRVEKEVQTKPLEENKNETSLTALQDEYRRLQQQMATQEKQVRSQLQREALRSLESWLIQWPTIATRAQAREDLAAAKILPFIRPVEQLMADWGVEAIASVDAEVAYNPQIHQLVGGRADPGDAVKVTHSGCMYQGKLLHRAKVKLL